MSTISEGYISVEEGLRLYYCGVGNDADPVIVTSASWLADDFEPFLRKHNLIFCDMRGRGASDPVTDRSQVQIGYDIRDLEAIQTHFGFEQISLVGWSIFANTAALYAAEHPERVRRLIMMCPGFVRSDAPYNDPSIQTNRAESRISPAALKHLDDLKQAGFDTSDPEAYCKEHQKAYLVRQMGKPQALARMRSNPCAFPNEWPRNLIAYLQKLPAMGAYDWRSKLASVRATTLVIHGLEDLIPLESSREWAAGIPGARLFAIPGAGHYPHLEEPEVFFPVVDSFLKGEWPAGAEVV